MLLVKDFKIQLEDAGGGYRAKAWNAHCQFEVEGKTAPETVRKAVQGCLEYVAARYFEAACIVCNSTNKMVYKNLPYLEMEQKISPVAGVPKGEFDNLALVKYEGKISKLDVEVELCHGFKLVRVAAIRPLTTTQLGI